MNPWRMDCALAAIAWAASLSVLMTSGCDSKSAVTLHIPNNSATDATVPNTDASPSVREPSGPFITGWEETVDGFLCRHVAVERDCQDGWCRIPAGCFVMGSPETEFNRGMNDERLAAVTLTHSFEISDHELNQEEWGKLVSLNPSGPGPDIQECIAPNCPVGHVTWFDAVWYANALSESHAPPLASCYALQDCTGQPGADLNCATVLTVSGTPYACEGYRLPTEAEWEYAARAGTRTAYYSGDITVTVHAVPDPNLEDIAWYAANTGNTTHPVAQKRPNRWGLFDVLGNMIEWVDERPIFSDPSGPLTDPTNSGTKFDLRVLKGGRADEWPRGQRVAGWIDFTLAARGNGIGIRLARTLPPLP